MKERLYLANAVKKTLILYEPFDIWNLDFIILSMYNSSSYVEVIMTSNYELIKIAIESKKQIHATYAGHSRKMCPHILGHKKAKSGGRWIKQMALFYQFAGSTSNGPLSEGCWKCMEVDKLSNVKIMDGEWHTGEKKTDRRSTCVDVVDVQVDLWKNL